MCEYSLPYESHWGENYHRLCSWSMLRQLSTSLVKFILGPARRLIVLSRVHEASACLVQASSPFVGLVGRKVSRIASFWSYIFQLPGNQQIFSLHKKSAGPFLMPYQCHGSMMSQPVYLPYWAETRKKYVYLHTVTLRSLRDYAVNGSEGFFRSMCVLSESSQSFLRGLSGP